jgi:hypothetical protein
MDRFRAAKVEAVGLARRAGQRSHQSGKKNRHEMDHLWDGLPCDDDNVEDDWNMMITLIMMIMIMTLMNVLSPERILRCFIMG